MGGSMGTGNVTHTLRFPVVCGQKPAVCAFRVTLFTSSDSLYSLLSFSISLCEINCTSDMFTHPLSGFSDVHSVLLLKYFVVLMVT